MDEEILQIIENTSSGKLKYMEKQAKKKNFDSVYDYLLDAKLQKERASTVAKANLYAKETKQIFHKLGSKSLQPKDLLTVLKAYGSLSPDELPKEQYSTDKSVIEKFPSFLNLKVLMEFFIEGEFGGSSRDYKNTFLEHEHLITNDEMFWTLCSTFWCVSNVGFTEETFNRYGRGKVPLVKRVELSTQFERYLDERHAVHSLDFQVERLKLWDDKDVIAPAYRVFKVGTGKAIRQSIVKDDPSAHIHKEGSSWSYSFQKSLACVVGLFWNRHLIKKYAECSDEEVEKILHKMYASNGTTDVHDATLYDGFYQCIGLFGLEKQNIEFFTDKWGEDEVVANPENAILIDYRFANGIDVLTSNIVRMWADELVSGHINRSSFIGLDGLFDLFRICVKKSVDENPDLIKNFVSDFSKERVNTAVTITNKVEELCGAKLGYKIVKLGSDDLVQIFVGDIPLERFMDGVRQRTSIPKKYIQR